MIIDEAIKQWATQRQCEFISAVNEHGSNRAAAVALNVSHQAVNEGIRRVKAAAAKAGYSPEHDMVRTVPDGYLVKGVSTYYNAEGKPSGQWIKSSIDRDRQQELLEEMLRGMTEDLPKLPASKAPTGKLNDHLMACYPIGDLHIGMLSWPDETGEPYDLKIAEEVQCGAMAKLVESSPSCTHATIINLGDWYHRDNMEGVTTRSGHALDVDGRFAKMAAVGVKIMRTCIESALRKHGYVHVINVVGNHDDTGALMLSICLANVYENDPRVTIDTNPSGFSYFRHGKTLVGCHHGHTAKADKLPGVMASDRAKDWGDTDHRYWWTGHVHHQSMKDYSGCSVESFRTLAAKDAYAHWGGYRAPRDMKCIILHDKHGEVSRHTVNPAMMDDSDD